MKKLMSIFLMFWLPLFMSSAWAMDLQMGSQMQYGMQMQEESSVSMAGMPCHDMQASIEPVETACADCLDNTSDIHNCASCGLCMISLTATQIETLVTSFNVSPSDAISLPDLAFFSLDYPPALKPPIHS